MNTITIYSNDLLGDDGTNFDDAEIAQFSGTQAECEEFFAENYNYNDYTMSYCG